MTLMRPQMKREVNPHGVVYTVYDGRHPLRRYSSMTAIALSLIGMVFAIANLVANILMRTSVDALLFSAILLIILGSILNLGSLFLTSSVRFTQTALHVHGRRVPWTEIRSVERNHREIVVYTDGPAIRLALARHHDEHIDALVEHIRASIPEHEDATEAEAEVRRVLNKATERA